jgi:hypothetical protein
MLQKQYSTPYHQDFLKKVDLGYYDFFAVGLSKIKSKKHINFLSDTPKSEWMSDGNHLNKHGGAIYSQKISLILKDSL